MAENVDSGGGSPAPVEVRRKESKELLGKDRIALQAALLLDGVKPGQGVTLDLQSVKKRILEENKSPETTKITNGSKHERDEFWKKEEYKHLDTFEERRDSWIEKTNIFLANYKKEKPEDADKPEAIILQKLGISVDNGAAQVYEDYFVQHEGDIGYFAMKVATELSGEEIKDNTALLTKIGKFYGKDSSEVARYLAEGIRNVKDNFVDFESVAAQQFNEQMEGVEIINGVHTRSEAWETKQKKKAEDAEKKKLEEARLAEEDRKSKEKEKEEEEKQKATQAATAAASAGGADQASSAVQPTAPDQETEKTPKKVKSFKTEQGSVYTYDQDGKTTRFRTATGKKYERQDITVFVDLTPDEEHKFLDVIHSAVDEDKELKVHILQNQPDNTAKILRDISEATDSDKVYLGILKDGKVVNAKKASTVPVMGYQAYDARHYQKNGVWMTDRHLGNKVVDIESEEPGASSTPPTQK